MSEFIHRETFQFLRKTSWTAPKPTAALFMKAVKNYLDLRKFGLQNVVNVE